MEDGSGPAAGALICPAIRNLSGPPGLQRRGKQLPSPPTPRGFHEVVLEYRLFVCLLQIWILGTAEGGGMWARWLFLCLILLVILNVLIYQFVD